MWLDDFEAFPPLTAIAERMASGAITAQQLVETCLTRIEAREPDVRAWTFVDAEGALRHAHALDRETPRGPLHGIPVGIKDVIDTAGIPTRLGSAAEQDRVPDEDAHCVAVLRERGAIVLGKTSTSEYASLAPTSTKNPRNLEHTPGGSSAGSAAAVGAGMVPFALGTQTLGSTIRPAAYCGVVGMKPSYGFLPLGGVLSVSQRLDTLGIFATSPDDLGTIIAEMSHGAPPARRSSPDASLPAFRAVRTPWWGRADDTSREAFERAVELLTAQRLSVTDGDLPRGAEDLPELQGLIAQFDMTNSLSVRFRRHGETFTPELAAKMIEADRIDPDHYWAAITRVEALRPSIQELFDDGRVMITPATTGVAPAISAGTGDSTFNRPWSILGNPVISVPVAVHSPTGLPLSVQLIGAVGSDLDLIRAAGLLARAARGRDGE